jgi:homoserine dehydrogenase
MVHVAILGFGTVGSGVAEVLSVNAEQIAAGAGKEIQLKYIVDIRDFPDSPYQKYMVKDFALVEKDPDVQIVVETIGGAKIAYEFTKRALLAGKSVVTSNKELVATHGYELLQIAHEKNVSYLFEASVGGGIPIIMPISQCLSANRIDEIYGILNGTTNYILTEMFKNGLPFDTALKQAQENGYAEANPAADIEGHDACRKISILSSLCFGHHVYPDQVPTEGITGVTGDDVELAGYKGYKIKLLGRALSGADGRIYAYVGPHLVPKDNLIAGVEGVMNGIVVRGNAIGSVMFYGAGAGKLPTASAVVSDVIDAAKHLGTAVRMPWGAGGAEYVGDADTLETAWYVRVTSGETAPEGAEKIGSINGYDGYILPKTCRSGVLKQTAGIEVQSMFRVLA